MIAAMLMASSHVFAQNAVGATDTARKKVVPTKPVVKKEKAPKAIRSEISGGVRLNSNGWSVFTDFGQVKNLDAKRPDMFYNTRLLQLEFTEKKHMRQEKTAADGREGSATSYVYGKANNFYAAKLGFGFRKLLVGKPDPGTVSIHWSNIIGFSAGLLKPYYLDTFGGYTPVKYTDESKDRFLDQDIIKGGSGFTKGIGEIKLVPGAHFKTALHFDFSNSKSNVLGAEAGVNVEFYGKNVQIMATEKPTKYFVDLFVALQFGKRW